MSDAPWELAWIAFFSGVFVVFVKGGWRGKSAGVGTVIMGRLVEDRCNLFLKQYLSTFSCCRSARRRQQIRAGFLGSSRGELLPPKKAVMTDWTRRQTLGVRISEKCLRDVAVRNTPPLWVLQNNRVRTPTNTQRISVRGSVVAEHRWRPDGADCKPFVSEERVGMIAQHVVVIDVNLHITRLIHALARAGQHLERLGHARIRNINRLADDAEGPPQPAKVLIVDGPHVLLTIFGVRLV